MVSLCLNMVFFQCAKIAQIHFVDVFLLSKYATFFTCLTQVIKVGVFYILLDRRGLHFAVLTKQKLGPID